MNKILRRFCYVLLVLTIVVIVWALLNSDNSDFEITFYRNVSDKVKEPVRIVLLSDLHNTVYGPDNDRLVQGITALNPDLILMAGDMVNGDEADTSIVTNLCRRLISCAPIYYILGNNEADLMYLPGGSQLPLDNELFEIGVNILYYEGMSVTIGSNNFWIDVAGETAITDYKPETDPSTVYRILMAHEPPSALECLYRSDFDLAVAGHYHGGQIRLPGGKGLFHPDTGFFPEYCYGKFRVSGSVLIVSRGLGKSGSLPRINNRPELVVIDISNM